MSLKNPSQCSTYHSNTSPETLEIARLILLSGVTCRDLVCEQTVMHRNSLAVERASCMLRADGHRWVQRTSWRVTLLNNSSSIRYLYDSLLKLCIGVLGVELRRHA